MEKGSPVDNLGENRNMPYPPSFKSTPAKIMDPETGASTWALGSHMWTPNTGNFTKNANTPEKKRRPEKNVEVCLTMKNIECPGPSESIKINKIRGREANNV